MSDYKLFTFASNKSGTKIFCRFTYKKKTITKGFYDFFSRFATISYKVGDNSKIQVSQYEEIKSNKEFKKALEQLSYEDTLNDISNIIKEKWKESIKIAKIKNALNKLKKKQ